MMIWVKNLLQTKGDVSLEKYLFTDIFGEFKRQTASDNEV